MPVNKTLDDYLAGVGCQPLADLRRQMIHRLVRMRVLDPVRLQKRYLVLVDGTGYLVFHQRPCDHCLTRKSGDKTIYMHQALEAKIVGPRGMVLSIATEFIDNRDLDGTPMEAGEEKRKHKESVAKKWSDYGCSRAS